MRFGAKGIAASTTDVIPEIQCISKESKPQIVDVGKGGGPGTVIATITIVRVFREIN